MTNQKSSILILTLIMIIAGLACGVRDITRHIGQIALQPVAETRGPAWSEFTSEAGNFRVHLPTEPVKLVEQSGDIEVHLFIVEMDTAAYFVGYNDLPDVLASDELDGKTLELVYDQGRDYILDSIGASLIGEASVSVAGFPGRQLEFSVADSQPAGGLVRLVAIGNRIYHLGVLGADGNPPQAEVVAFFDSFALLETPIVKESVIK